MGLPVAAVLAFAQIAGGAAKANKGANAERNARAEAAALLRKRKTYQTPDELYKILQATEYDAQTGFDASTLNYLTTQTDRAFDSSLDNSRLLGGDPNSYSELFNNKVNAIMGIAEKGHTLKMEKFSKYLSAQKMIAASKDAEWLSKDNLIKDRLQATQLIRAEGAKEKQAGINAVVSAATNFGTSMLYKGGDNTTDTLSDFNNSFGDQGAGAFKYAQDNGLTLDEYNKELLKASSNLNTNNFNF